MIKFEKQMETMTDAAIIGGFLVQITTIALVYFIRLLKKEKSYTAYLTIKPLTILLVGIYCYLFRSIYLSDFNIDPKDIFDISIISFILTIIGWKWFPYWEE